MINKNFSAELKDTRSPQQYMLSLLSFSQKVERLLLVERSVPKLKELQWPTVSSMARMRALIGQKKDPEN